MYRKSLVAVFLALLLVLLAHKGVAGPLEILPPMVGGEKNRTPLSCNNLAKHAQDWLEEQDRQNRRFAAYIQSANTQYSRWHEELEAREEKTAPWEDGFFSPLTQTAAHFLQSSDTIGSDGGLDDEFLLEFHSQIEECYAESAARTAVLAELDRHMEMQYEHWSSVAGFIAGMKPRLADWGAVWERLEGSATRVPAGYFSPLMSEANLFTEARRLVEENSGLLTTQYQNFLQKFSALAQDITPR